MSGKLRLLKKDILVTPKNINEVEKSTIHIVSDSEQKEKLNYFEVLVVSDQVTMVKPGDIIILGYMNHMSPIEWEGKMCAITSEDMVEAVIED